MSGIRTNAAAAMLGVSPNTLRSWERRYGFPQPQRSTGGHRQYALAEVESLRLALNETHNVSSAVSLARERGEGPSSSTRLAGALSDFDEDRAARMLEESLALRSVERTIEEVLLPGVESLIDRQRMTAEYDFAWRFSTAWLSALKRLSPPASRADGVLILDASNQLDVDALHAQALDLLLRRAGLRTLALSPAVDPARLSRAVRALGPEALVLTGRRVTLDAIGRLVYAVRSVSQTVTVFDFRHAVPDTGASTVLRLGDRPLAARELLLERLTPGARAARSTPAHSPIAVA